MNKTALILVLITTLFSCKKHKLKDEKAMLEGSWEWVFSVKSETSLTGGWSYSDTIFPSDVASSYNVVFKKNGKVHFLENGEMINKYRVVFHKFQEPGAILPLFVNNGTLYEFDIKLNNENENSMLGFVSSDSLRFINRNFPFQNETNTSSLLVHKNYFKRIE